MRVISRLQKPGQSIVQINTEVHGTSKAVAPAAAIEGEADGAIRNT
jgi:hypothetical protein